MNWLRGVRVIPVIAIVACRLEMGIWYPFEVVMGAALVVAAMKTIRWAHAA